MEKSSSSSEGRDDEDNDNEGDTDFGLSTEREDVFIATVVEEELAMSKHR